MAFDNDQRSRDLFDLLTTLEVPELEGLKVSEIEAITAALAASDRFDGQQDLVLAIAEANNPTLVIKASNDLLRRSWAIALIAGAREDRDNELSALSVQPSKLVRRWEVWKIRL